MGALIIDAHYKLIAHILGNAMLSILLLWLRRRETLGVFASCTPWCPGLK